MKPKLIIDDAIPFLDGRLEPHFDCRYMPGEDIKRQDLRDADGLLVRTRTKCNAELLEGTSVKFVATGTIGIDHIDTGWCDANGITWLNAPGCNAPPVAHYVFRALLELGMPLDCLDLPEERRPVLGVVGKGHVGGLVTDWGRRLGLNVIVSDPPRAARGLDDENYLPLSDLMARADAVTFHTPMIKEDTADMKSTLHLADDRHLRMLRDGAILINAARGGIVDEAALLEIAPVRNLRLASHQGKERATRAILSGLEEHFGVTLHISDLSAPYTPSEHLSESALRDSYDIMTDDYMMRHHYEEFEHMRNSYPLREEVK